MLIRLAPILIRVGILLLEYKHLKSFAVPVDRTQVVESSRMTWDFFLKRVFIEVVEFLFVLESARG